MNSAQLMMLGVVIVFVGFMVVAGTFLGSGGSSSTGGFILIGPFPIVFGNGPGSGTLAAAALAISLVMMVVYLVSFFVLRSCRREEAEVGTKSGFC